MTRVFIGMLKIIAVTLLVAGMLFYVLVNHSTLTQELTCNGYWRERGDEEVAHVQLTEYRWWVHLWAESDGNVKMHAEKLAVANYVEFVRKIGEGSLALYEFRDDKGRGFKGGYRVSKGEMTIKLSDSLIFVGSCKPR
jgi:hypothetical protein